MRRELVLPEACVAAAPLSLLARALRAGLFKQLAHLQHGHLVIEDPCGRTELGERGAALQARVTVRDGRFYSAVAARGSVGAAEAYMEGLWSCDNLVALVRILVLNRQLLD